MFDTTNTPPENGVSFEVPLEMLEIVQVNSDCTASKVRLT